MSIEWDKLKDRSVLITGGASGLGEATAKKFYEYGAYITIADLQEDLGNNLVKDLGDRSTFVKCNTTDWDSLAAAFKHAANFAPSKTIDVVILYAGVDGERRGLVDLVLDQPEPSLDNDPTPAKPTHRALDINLDAVYVSTYLALHYFRLPAQNGNQNFKKSLNPDLEYHGLHGLALQHRIRDVQVRRARHVPQYQECNGESQCESQ